MSLKVFLDDLRNPPDDTWTVVRNVAAAKEVFLAGPVEAASLDHDLGEACETCFPAERIVNGVPTPIAIVERVCDAKTCSCSCHETGYDFVKWLGETRRWPLQKPAVHSANPVGKANMIAYIERYWEPHQARDVPRMPKE